MAKKKTLEPVHAAGHEPADKNVAGLDIALAKGHHADEEERVFQRYEDKLEAATITRHGVEMLFVGVPGPGQPAIAWYSVARFAPMNVGPHEFLAGRRSLAPLTAATLGALELAFNRPAPHYLANDPEPAEPVEIEAAATVQAMNSRAKTLWIKYRTLWFAVGALRWRAPPVVGRDLSPAGRGLNHPDIEPV